MASAINRIEIIAVDSLAARVAPVTASPLAVVLPKVLATIELKAATTRIRVRYPKVKNSFLAALPIELSMISPIDCPLFLREANRAPKSCTPPKKIPPIKTHKRTGTQPKTAAWIGPFIGRVEFYSLMSLTMEKVEKRLTDLSGALAHNYPEIKLTKYRYQPLRVVNRPAGN